MQLVIATDTHANVQSGAAVDGDTESAVRTYKCRQEIKMLQNGYTDLTVTIDAAEGTVVATVEKSAVSGYERRLQWQIYYTY